MATEAQIEGLVQRMRKMSAADISVLEARSQTPDSSMTATPGSQNEALWSEMAELGWKVIREDEIDLTGGKRYVMKTYTISTEGLQPIVNSLSTLSRE